jgi:hypothetical protein
MLGLTRGYDGIVRLMDSPYKGAKILAGASAGEILFYDPMGRLDAAQYGGCDAHPLDDKKWEEVEARLRHLEKIFSLGISEENSHLSARIDGQHCSLVPEHFKWIVPVGVLEGYH